MTFEIGGEQITRLTDLRRNSRQLIERLKQAKTPRESRLILTTHGEPVAILQDYKAYQALLTRQEETQKALEIVETRERLRQLKAGEIGSVPLQQVARRRRAPDDNR
jgi:hypothetical protein